MSWSWAAEGATGRRHRGLARGGRSDKTAPLWHGTRNRTTRLIHWARVGDLSRVRETLSRGADVSVRDTYGRTALWWASRGGRLAVVRELLGCGADADACSNALHVASEGGHTDVVMELAARGADVNARDNGGETPLTYACYHDNTATVAELLRLGADVNAVGNGSWSALVHAAYGGNVDAVRMLLAAPGVNINFSDASGNTTLSIARSYGRGAVVALLEAAGAR